MDAIANLAYTTVAVAPSPASSGTSLTVPLGHGIRFPAVPFNAVICAANEIPVVTNSEIVRVTARSSDTLTITRGQEATGAFPSSRAVVVGDQIYAGTTKLVLDQVNAWTPYGQPIDVPFSAAQFTAVGGTWAVSGQNTNSYTVIGKLVMYHCHLGVSTVTGSVSKLVIALPAGHVASRMIGGGGGPYAGPINGIAGTFINGATIELTAVGFGGSWTAGTYGAISISVWYFI